MIWRRFFHRARRDAELARDIEFHLEAETDDNIARGMPADVAREHARSNLATQLSFARRFTA